MALNKIDVPDGRDWSTSCSTTCERAGSTVFPVSAATHEGLRELSFAMASVVERARAARPAVEPQRIVIRPLATVRRRRSSR